MRKFLIGLGAVAALSTTPALTQAQVSLGPTLAITEDGDLGIGGTIGAPMNALGEGIRFMGDFIYYFPELGNYFEIDGNLTYDFPLAESTVLPFVLAGINFGRGSGDTDVGLNIGGGIVFDAGSFRPAVGGRFTLRQGSPFIIFATLPFAMGGQGN